MVPQRVTEYIILHIRGLAHAPHHWEADLCTHWCILHQNPNYMPPWEHLKLATANPKPNKTLCGLTRPISTSNQPARNTHISTAQQLNGQRAADTSEGPRRQHGQRDVCSFPEQRQPSPPKSLGPRARAVHLKQKTKIGHERQNGGREAHECNELLTIL